MEFIGLSRLLRALRAPLLPKSGDCIGRLRFVLSKLGSPPFTSYWSRGQFRNRAPLPDKGLSVGSVRRILKMRQGTKSRRLLKHTHVLPRVRGWGVTRAYSHVANAAARYDLEKKVQAGLPRNWWQTGLEITTTLAISD